ncbi:MAG: glycosyltransferase 87 family protein, partial [Ktedonobacterales bacterium]
GYPNYNPPLSIFLMAPFLKLGQALGFAHNYGEQITIVALPFLIFVPLLGLLVLRVLSQLYPTMPETQRLLAYVLITLSPLTWQAYSPWYHLEQPMMLCFLVAAVFALQTQREALAGVLAGLAVLTRTTALMPLIALGTLLLAAGNWRSLMRLAAPAIVVAGVGLAPFFLVDRANAIYSFVTWRGTAAIGGNSIWDIFAPSAGGIRHTLNSAARRLDMPSVIVVVLIVAYFAARRLRISAYSREAWAVLAIAALTVPMLSKTNWPYYYLEPFVLLVIWEFGSLHDRRAGLWRWPVLSVAFLAVAGTLSQYIGLQSVGYLDRVTVGLLEFAAMAGFAIAIWRRAQAAKPGAASQEAAFMGAEPAEAVPPIVTRRAPARPEPTSWASPTMPAASSPAVGASGRMNMPNSGPVPAQPLWPPAPADARGRGAGNGRQGQQPAEPPNGTVPGTDVPWPDLDAGWPLNPPGAQRRNP